MTDSEKVPVMTTTASKDAEKATRGAAAGKESPALPGFEIIKVRMPDGIIRRVKRPIVAAQVPPEKKTAGSSAGIATNGQAEAAAIPTKKNEVKLSPKNPSTVAVAAASTSTDASKSSQAEKSLSSTKPTSVPPRAVPDAVPLQARQRSSRSFFSAFAARAVTAMIPSIGDIEDIGELQDGDVILNDSDDSDGFDDDDDDHDGCDDNETHHGDAHGGHQQLESKAAMAGAEGLAAGLAVRPPAYPMTRNRVAQNQAKSGVNISEKDIGDNVKPGDAETQRLHNTYSEWTRYIIWFIMISFPMLYIVLGILTAMLPKKEYGGQFGLGLKQAITIAVSAWPIIFAAIAAQSLRAIASYKVERGIRLMTLEQLMGSNSVASSIKQPFLLWRFDIVTIALLSLWSLSPLATQALQRMSYPTTNDFSQNITVYYLDTCSNNQVFGADATEPGAVAYDSLITQFFASSMLPAGQNQMPYQDAWARPKIPIIEYLDKRFADKDGWIDPLSAASNSNGNSNGYPDYSSNYGIPLEEMKNSGAYNFTILSSYLYFECSDLKTGSTDDWNTTGTKFYSFTDNQTDATVNLDIIPQNGTKPGRVIFAADALYHGEYLYSICNFTQTFVDSMILCDNSVANTQNYSSSDYQPPNNDCWVELMRKTPSPPANTIMGDFTDGFGRAAGSVIDGYLYAPNNISSLIGNGTFDLRTVTTIDFTKRLGRLINTYWQLGFGPTVQDSGLNHLTSDRYLAVTKDCAATLTVQTDAYGVSVGWLAALFICSGILLLASIMSMTMDARTIVPDMLGYASSLARKSRYVDLPKVNSSMSGAERAKLLGDHRVMMQDVKPDALVGKVALGSAHPSAKRLAKGRFYR